MKKPRFVLVTDIVAAATSTAPKARYANVGAVPIILTPAEARARIASDSEKWRKIIEQAGLNPE